MKTTLKDIKEYIRIGLATDITYYSFDQINELRKDTWFDTVAYSTGVYGLNGVVLRDHKTGKMYAIASRTNALFQMM